METASSWRAFVDQSAHGLDRPPEHVGGVEKFLAQLHLAARDARHVEQIVDEPGKLPQLPLDNLHAPRHILGRGLAAVGQGDGVANGGQGVAQFMGEHGQKLVLSLVVAAQFLVEPRVFNRPGGDLGKLFEQGSVVRVEDAAFLLGELDDA